MKNENAPTTKHQYFDQQKLIHLKYFIITFLLEVTIGRHYVITSCSLFKY